MTILAAVPVEVKSGWVTQAKSLKSFTDKYHPPFCAVFSGRTLGFDPRLRKHYYPLFLASKFLLRSTCAWRHLQDESQSVLLVPHG